MGKATVRLAANGARITNCQILGADVAVGEKVVLDYSAEGAPVVRPYTIKGAELPVEVTDPEPEPEVGPESWCYAKYTVSDDALDDNGGCRVYLVDSGGIYLDPGFAYGSFSGQYRYQSNFTNTIPFNEVVFDNADILATRPPVPANPNGWGYFAPPAGSYLVTVCFALDIGTNDLGYIGTYANLDIGVNSTALVPHTGQGNGSIHVTAREHHAIYRQTWIAKFEGQGSTFRFSATLFSAGANVYDASNLPSRADPSKATYLKLAKLDGVYPMLELYKIADVGTYKTAIPYWNWEHYDYPDG
jgi:hypothetical protein